LGETDIPVVWGGNDLRHGGWKTKTRTKGLLPKKRSKVGYDQKKKKGINHQTKQLQTQQEINKNQKSNRRRSKNRTKGNFSWTTPKKRTRWFILPKGAGQKKHKLRLRKVGPGKKDGQNGTTHHRKLVKVLGRGHK